MIFYSQNYSLYKIIHPRIIVYEPFTLVMSCYPLRMKIHLIEKEEMPEPETLSEE